MGEMFVDFLTGPNVALARFDFLYLAGNHHHENASLAIDRLQPGRTVVVPNRQWADVLAQEWAGPVIPLQREAFVAGSFDTEKLTCFANDIPDGFELCDVDLAHVAKFAEELEPELVSYFDSHQDFIDRGAGVGIVHNGAFVSGASVAAVGNGKAEFEIHTAPAFRRRGFARAVGAALILSCLKKRLQPCWDAANHESSKLAVQLGFVSSGQYHAYRLGDRHADVRAR
jgi:hypothetical protein